MDIPIVLLIFKRSDTFKKVFDVIRKVKPRKLFIVADGARVNRFEEEKKCAETRAIVDQVDWDCTIFKDYSDINLGCEKRVSSGLSWVFSQVDRAIILEDDCVPHPSFFPFCEELLERYQHDRRIMSISGFNDQPHHRRTDHSYYFSLYNRCWGWATWRRAWQQFDFDMTLWPELREKKFLDDLLVDSQAVKFWTKTYQSVYEGNINTWAYRWKFNCWSQSGLSIIPSTNLISNIGFGKEATNTKNSDQKQINLPVKGLTFPLSHPPYVIRDMQSEKMVQKRAYYQSLLKRARFKLMKMFD